MLTVLLIAVAAGLVVASVLTDSLPLAIAGLVVALVGLGLIVWPVLMARRAAAVEAEDREDAATRSPEPAGDDEPEPAVDDEPEPAGDDEPESAVVVESEAAVDEPAPAVVEPMVAGTVLVVAGRHRYHRAGCSMLEGREPETLDLDEAREEGFTPCSRCAVGALPRS